MKYKHRMRFFATEGDAGGEPEREVIEPVEKGGDPQLSKGMSIFDKPEEVVVEPEPKAEEVVPPEPKPTPEVPAAPTTVDVTELAKQFAEAMRQKPDATQEEKQLTPEEAKKILNIWEPTKDWYEKLDNLETREAALKEQRDGLTLQFDTISKLRLQEQEERLTQKFSPALDYIAEKETRERQERFEKTYPILADPKLSDMVDTVGRQLIEKKVTFKSETDLFKAIATGVEAIAKTFNPEFKISEGSSPSQTQTRKHTPNPNAIPVTTPGGGGGGGQSGAAPAKSRGLAIFDKN